MKQQIQYIRQVMKYKLWSMRTLVFVIVQFIVLYMYIKPVRKFSIDMDYPSAPWLFPFLISNLLFLFLFLLGTIYYYSDVPFMQYQNMYQIIRIGRKRWAIGQIAGICIQSFLIIAFEMGVSILLLAGHLEWTDDWGKLMHTLALKGMPDHYQAMFGISYDSMQIFTPLSLTALSFLVCGLTLCLLGLMMFAISLFAGRIAAAAVATGMTIMIYFIENVHPLLARKTAMFIPTGWMRISNLGVKVHGGWQLPPLSYILSVLIIGIVLLGVVIVWKIKNVEFQWMKED